MLLYARAAHAISVAHAMQALVALYLYIMLNVGTLHYGRAVLYWIAALPVIGAAPVCTAQVPLHEECHNHQLLLSTLYMSNSSPAYIQTQDTQVASSSQVATLQ